MALKQTSALAKTVDEFGALAHAPLSLLRRLRAMIEPKGEAAGRAAGALERIEQCLDHTIAARFQRVPQLGAAG